MTCEPGSIIENGCNLSQVFTFTATSCGQTSTCTRTFTWTNCASLGDFVWHDTNANGIQDPGELGIPGVTVTLYQCSNGNVVGVPIVTGPNGEYLFTGLTPGSYYVGFGNLPPGYFFSPNDMGGNDNADSDANPGTGLTGCEILAPGENNLTYDAGLYQQASISNFVWSDTNNNGIQDPTELGVPGVTVTLYQCSNNSVVGVPIVTGPNGQYLFSGLTPGNYYVGFSNLPAGFFFSPNDMGGNDATDSDANTGTGLTGCETLTSGENNTTYDAGLSSTTETCYESCTGNNNVGAIMYTTNANNTVTIRVKFAKTFVDNTYGSNTIGWPAGNHTFNHLVTSDHVQLALYDLTNTKKMEFKLDYISASTATPAKPSGYKTLGVSGGDGSMILGNASNVISALSSMDVNLNNNGPSYYLFTNSPLTNANYDPNPTYPNWIYDAWYEVTVNLAAFPAGFKEAKISSLHASPSKTGNNTECVQPCLPLEVVAVGSNGPCATTCQGSITASASHGNEPYTYTWSDGPATGATRTGLCPGNYTVTAHDSSGFTATAIVTIGAAVATCPTGNCYESCTGNSAVGATQTVVDNGNGTTTIRTTFAKTFVDNTYGTNAIGWPGSHTFSNLTGSDKLQLALYDAGGTKRLEFKIDYISAATATASNPSGYKTLGVSGGDGGMITGSATNVVGALTSMDVNLNTNGPSYYLTANSPLTNSSYATNLSPYPNWIYDVWYEVTVRNSAFPGGFGYPLITSVHASPSKTGNNTECVQPCLPVSVTAVGNNGPCGSVGCVGSITATAAHGITPYTYTWSDGPVTGATRTGLCTGSYTVTVHDANWVTAQATVVIAATQPAPCGICYQGCNNNPAVGATQTVVDNGNGTTTIRTTFAKTFVDNTYGSNTVGWPANNHTFKHLTGSDKLQLALYDTGGTKRLEFAIDYLTATTVTAASPSGYKTLGVSGGDGSMIFGSATNVVSALTSLDVNLNTNGPSYYLTTNSPLTNTSYATNLSPYPNWIYDVWYEVTVRNSAFPGGFGYPSITSVHASPSKTGNNTECVMPCAAPKDVVAPRVNDTIGFDVYPVPFKDLLTVRYQFDNDSEVKIEIINLLGMTIFSQTDTDGYIGKEVELNLNLNIVKDQVYFIKLTTNKGSVTKKIISQR